MVNLKFNQKKTNTQNNSGTPDTSGTPGTPDTSGTPGTSGTSGTPGTPGTPGTSGTSGTPGTSVVKNKLQTKKVKDASSILNPFKTEPESEREYSSSDVVINTSLRTILIGLDNYEYIINKWYNDSLQNTDTKFLLLIGPTGCGKTTLINNYCIDKNINVFRTNDFVKSKKELLKDIVYFTQFSNSFQCFNNQTNKIIFIDEYQNSTNDALAISDINILYEFRSGNTKKMIVKELVNLFGTDWNILKNIKLPPVIIISADSKGSRLSDLKKLTDVYYINDINKNLIKTWIIERNELLKKHEQMVDLLIHKCNNDIRLLLNTINFIGNDYSIFSSGKPINLINDCYKIEDVNLYEFIKQLFDNIERIEIDEIFKVYDTDGYVLSNIVQENYLDYSDDIELISKSADAISYGDIVLNDLYDSNKMFMNEIHCIYSLYIPSVYSKSDVKNNKCPIRTSILNNRYNIYINNKNTIGKLNVGQSVILDIFTILHIKKFINYELIKNKSINSNQLEYLKNILGLFDTNKIEKLELIYKSFNEFKDNPINKTKTFTQKFKEKLNKLIN